MGIGKDGLQVASRDCHAFFKSSQWQKKMDSHFHGNDRGGAGMTYGGSGDEREGKDGSDKSAPYLLYRFDNRIYFL